MRNTLTLVLLSILLLPNAALADRLFVGNVVMVSSQMTRGPSVVRADNVSIRLDDGRLINPRLQKRGELAALAISARYKFGDRVEVTCKGEQLYELELKKIRFLAPASPEELSKVTATLYWKKGENLLKTPPIPEWPSVAPAAAPESADVERLREVNLRTLEMMPDFVTHERAERTLVRKGVAKPKVDIIESEMTFTGKRSSREALRVNGKAASFPPGLYWNIGWGIGFGSELHALFDRNCGTTFEPKEAEEIRGKQLAVYAFHSPADGCFGPDWMGSTERDTARDGRIWVDAAGNVIQTEIRESPLEEFAALEVKMVWDYVRIEDALHLLPVEDHYVYTMSGLLAGDVWTISVQYKDHKHFQVSSTIKSPEVTR